MKVLIHPHHPLYLSSLNINKFINIARIIVLKLKEILSKIVDNGNKLSSI